MEMREFGKLSRVIVVGFSLWPLLSSCSTAPRSLTAEELSRIRQQPKFTVMVHQPPPTFERNTSSGDGMAVTFGPIGLAAANMMARSSGKGIQAEIGLEDPAFRVKDHFLAGLTSEMRLTEPSVQEVFETDDAEHLKQSLKSGWLLEFRTAHWGLGATSNLFGPNQYEVGYMGEARLTRLEEGEPLWQGFCISGSREHKKATIAMLQENEGAILKAWLAEAAELCAKQLLSQFLGKSESPFSAQ